MEASMNRDERLALASEVTKQITAILEGWFGEAIEHMDDEKRVRKYLLEPLIAAALRQSSERDAVVEALQAVAEFMRKDVQSGDSDLWTPEYEALHDQVIVALKGAKP